MVRTQERGEEETYSAAAGECAVFTECTYRYMQVMHAGLHGQK